MRDIVEKLAKGDVLDKLRNLYVELEKAESNLYWAKENVKFKKEPLERIQYSIDKILGEFNE